MASENGRKSNKEIWERISTLESQVDNIKKQIEKLISNDLSHIDKKIDKNSDKIDLLVEKQSAMDNKLAYIFGGLAILQILLPFISEILGK